MKEVEAWKLYNFINDYKSGEFGFVTLQFALDNCFEGEVKPPSFNIRIERVTEPPFIGCFKVKYMDMESSELAWGEMMDLVASLTIPENKPSLQWLKPNTKKDDE